MSLFLSYFIFINNHGKENKMLKNDPLLTALLIFSRCIGNVRSKKKNFIYIIFLLI